MNAHQAKRSSHMKAKYTRQYSITAANKAKNIAAQKEFAAKQTAKRTARKAATT